MRVRLFRPFSVEEIGKAISARSLPASQANYEFICTDTREIEKGDLFFAIKGTQFNGEDFVIDAIDAGATPVSAECNVGFNVENTIDALLSLAGFYRTTLPCLKTVVGITGSVGKTTLKDISNELISNKLRTRATSGNLNNCIGVALTVLSAPIETEVLILEIGMNHPGEISKIVSYVPVDIGVITCIGQAHLGNLVDRTGVAKAKSELAEGKGIKTVLCEKEEPLLSKVTPRTEFSFHDIKSEYYLDIKECNRLGGVLTMYRRGRFVKRFTTELLGKHNIRALGIALCICELTGIYARDIPTRIIERPFVNNMRRLVKLRSFSIFDDSYSSSPEAVISAIQMLMLLGEYSAVLGDILELGDSAREIHLNLGKRLSSLRPNNIYLFGELAQYIGYGAISAGFPAERVFFNPDIEAPKATAKQIMNNYTRNEIILIKASNKIKIGRVSEKLMEMSQHD